MTKDNNNVPVKAENELAESRNENAAQFVTFYFGKHFFGLPIDDVIEINRALDVTPVPLAPSYVAGVVNLRGQILTAIDLANRIGLNIEKNEEDGFNNVIMGDREEPVSLLVQSIGDVMSVPSSQIEPTPELIEGVDVKYVSHVCKLPGQLLIILNSNALEQAENVNDSQG